MTKGSHPRFVALVPVKATDTGKSRLVRLLAPERGRLALAFALDTIEAVRATPGIESTVVVTSDDEVARQARLRGCDVAPDDGGLNSSLRGATKDRSGHLVAICGDLPALRPDDLADALVQLSVDGPAFVADSDGTGTTTYAAPLDVFDPHFGAGSARAHAEAGARAAYGDLVTLRHDVDTWEDLVDLAARGLLGRHTCEALGSISLPRLG